MSVDEERSAVPWRIERGDPRYEDLAGRGSKRFAGRPDRVYAVQTTEQVVSAVQASVSERLRLAVRSGGHCFEAFVSDPDVRVVIDTSLMSDVYYDRDRAAFAVEAGARLGDVYRKLFLGWDVTIPAGVAANVGVGGHIVGGAFGFLCRKHGLAADHLYAVEVVVVDDQGMAKSIVATREPSDPNRELWWAHTGGGGGNFGVVTRYWFRSPGASLRGAPSGLLPAAPDSVLTFKAEWSTELDERAFVRLARNYGAWCEQNGEPDSPARDLYSSLFLGRRQLGKHSLRGIAIGPVDEGLFAEHLAFINDGVGAHCTHESQRRTWLSHVFDPFPGMPMGAEGSTFKLKDALLRRRYGDAQLATAYRHLTRTDVDVAGGAFGLTTYGGQTNAVAPDATASVHRDALMTTSCSVGWADPGDEAKCLSWVREFYRELFADTGGVPTPGKLVAGALVNHADVDLADPAHNTSGVPFSAIYYGGNYPRLQRAKSHWDPLDVFRHPLSIRPEKG